MATGTQEPQFPGNGIVSPGGGRGEASGMLHGGLVRSGVALVAGAASARRVR